MKHELPSILLEWNGLEGGEVGKEESGSARIENLSE